MSAFLAESYLHRLDEVAIPIYGGFGIRWYALSYLAGFLFGWIFLAWMARTGRTTLRPRMIGDLMVYGMASVMIGGRLGYAIFYEPRLFLGFTELFPFWDLLAIHRGGMASHGGIIGVAVGCFIFAHGAAFSGLNLLDMGAISCLVGLCLGRVANFVNGELWGKALPMSRQSFVPGAAADPPWWSIKYPEEILAWNDETPYVAERFAALDPLAGLVEPGDRFLQHVVRAAEKGEAAVVDAITPALTAYYPSQILQALTDGPILIALLAVIWWKPRRPGVVGSWFLLGYGVLRILTEAVRQPDEGVALIMGLSRGQLLSVLMIIAGLVLIPLCAHRDVAPQGGFARRYAKPVAQDDQASG